MSILTRPQGSPERVLSVVAALAALGGKAPREDLSAMLNPGYVKNGDEIRAAPSFGRDIFGAATALGLMEIDSKNARLDLATTPTTSVGLSDFVHDRFRGLPVADSDNVMLETYAWIAVESDRQGDLGWLFDLSGDEFSDRVNEALLGQDEDGKLMNPTKAVAWRRWLIFLGLLIPALDGLPFPLPSARIHRELERGAIGSSKEVSAEAFVTQIAQRQPYLDRGRLFHQVSERIGHRANPRQLSPLLSGALRDLHDAGTIELMLSGDSAGAIQLSSDCPHKFKSFDAVLYRSEEASQ